MTMGPAQAAVAGVSSFIPGKGEFAPDYWRLQVGLARDAVRDAGLSPRDVDGVVFTRSGYPMAKSVFPTTFCEQLGIQPAWMETAPHGGAQMGSQIWRATNGIRNGFAKVVLIVAADNRESRFSRRGVVSRIATQNMEPEFELPYGPIFPTFLALMAQRQMHELGRTEEQNASQSVAQRHWASLHPGARMRDRITVDDVLASKLISTPLHLLDYCLVTDGGGAAVVVAPDHAKDLAKPPVYVLGYGDSGQSQSLPALFDLANPPMYRKAAEQAFSMAGLQPADIDVAYPYDPSSAFALWGLEQIGLCEPGGAGKLAEAGETGPGGSLPCNTHGGLLSFGHPGSAGAFLSIIEAVRQLRGEAGERQVPDAGVALTSAIGGIIATGVNIFGNERAMQR